MVQWLIYILKFSSKGKRIKLEEPSGDVLYLGDTKHESVEDAADRRAKERVVKTLVTGSEKMRSEEPIDEQLYSHMLEDVDRLGRLVRDKKFMQTVTQNVSYGRLASYRVKGFFPMLAAAILNES